VLKASLIVHGGSRDIPPDLTDAHEEGCRAALLEGWEILQSGGHALDAVERAIRRMEDDPTFNAGSGSVLNSEGEIELDAAIMEGRSLQAGAVAAVQNIKNPISLARRVLESELVFVVGRGALVFAREMGMAQCRREELLVARELKRWQALRNDAASPMQDTLGFPKEDTVGAVALDQGGNIAVGNSTGGRPHKHPGRVGDAPLVGCGIYADNRLGGAACTGWGEAIIRVAMAKTTVDLLGGPRPAQEAAALAVQLLEERVEGLGGVILIDSTGNVACSHNTPKMAYAYLTEDLKQPMVGV
jgi:beta-aspartyl-peptidase (threonine type)